jgi:hypothetical protein
MIKKIKQLNKALMGKSNALKGFRESVVGANRDPDKAGKSSRSFPLNGLPV